MSSAAFHLTQMNRIAFHLKAKMWILFCLMPMSLVAFQTATHDRIEMTRVLALPHELASVALQAALLEN
jgi:hypothetical protein